MIDKVGDCQAGEEAQEFINVRMATKDEVWKTYLVFSLSSEHLYVFQVSFKDHTQAPNLDEPVILLMLPREPGLSSESTALVEVSKKGAHWMYFQSYSHPEILHHSF